MSTSKHPSEIVVRTARGALRWPHAEGHTILETARRVGFALPSQCERAYCGTCVVLLLRGEIDMRMNEVLNEADIAQGLRVACQGVPVGPVCEIELL